MNSAHNNKSKNNHKRKFDYDLVVIGGGASGMFAAGTAASLGCKTLLIEKNRRVHEHPTNKTNSNVLDVAVVGGDCTNYACVPSKSIRAVAKLSSLQQKRQQKQHYDILMDDNSENNGKRSLTSFFQVAKQHATNVVSKVRERESIDRLSTSSPNLNLVFANKTSFVSNTQLCLQGGTMMYGPNNPITPLPMIDSATTNQNNNNDVSVIEFDQWNVTFKRTIIATGADPIVPQHLKDAAKHAGIPLLTYRSLFSPEGKLADEVLWSSFTSLKSKHVQCQNIVIAGGGPTACEIGQSLARLLLVASTNKEVSTLKDDRSPTYCNITVVAPEVLKEEDVSARYVARQILQNDGVKLIQGKVVDMIIEDPPTSPPTKDSDKMQSDTKKAVITRNNQTSTIPCDILILALGRAPGTSLCELDLHKAGVKWSWNDGVVVDRQLCSSTKNIFASGDCASIIPQRDRRASHAGWTGYHAVQSALFPKLFRPKSCVHEYVPRVTFMDPEIASIGLTREECVARYGHGGFKYFFLNEMGSDRSDMDLPLEHTVPGFIELRVLPPDGRIIGATICSSVASELINEIGVIMTNGLSCRDVARSLHSYPSRGYLLYRVSLALALSDVWGLLAATNAFGRTIGFLGETVIARPVSLWHRFKTSKAKRKWEAEGQRKEIKFQLVDDENAYGSFLKGGTSWLEASFNQDFCNLCKTQVFEKEVDISYDDKISLKEFTDWLERRPKR